MRKPTIVDYKVGGLPGKIPKVEKGKIGKYCLVLTQHEKKRVDILVELGLKSITTSQVYGIRVRNLVETAEKVKRTKLI